MNVLLANPKSRSAFESFGLVFPPLGLLYVAAAAEKAGFGVALEDFFVSRNRPSRFDFRDYDVVGITSDARRFPAALEIAESAKRQGCTVVMGGPHPTFVDEDVLADGHADFIVKGEGEVTFPELLGTIGRGEDPCHVKGISYRVRGRVVRTAPRELVEDLDSLPFPARHLVDIGAYKRFGVKYGGTRSIAVLSTSRGCPNECDFCISPQLHGRRWRSRTPESVVSEIEHLYYDYGYRAFAFSDDNFTVSPARVRAICRLILEKKLDIWWWSLSTTGILLRNEEMVSLMAKAGAKTVYIGVESPDPETLRAFNKDAEPDATTKAVALLKRNNIEIFASYILGGLTDDTKAILRTIRFARSLDTSVAQFSILTPYPGTVLFNKLKDRLRHKKWHLYDGTRLVFKHERVPFVSMELLLIWAYVSFYARGWRAMRGFLKALARNTLVLKRLCGKAK